MESHFEKVIALPSPKSLISTDFRQDLLYRINTIHINIPPLRNRKEDIIPLAEIFLKRLSEKYNRPNISISSSAEARLLSYSWDGNIRELQHTMEKAVLMCDDDVTMPEHLGLFHSAKPAVDNNTAYRASVNFVCGIGLVRRLRLVVPADYQRPIDCGRHSASSESI